MPAQVSLGSLLLDGSFTQTGSTYSATGPVDIGFAPTSTESFTPLTVWDGDLSFTSGGSSFTFSGSVQAIEQSADVAIAQVASSQTFSVTSLTGAGVGISGSPLGVLGASFTPTNLALVDPAGGNTTGSYVSLQGTLAFTQLAGLSVPVSGSNLVQISPASSSPGLTLVAAASSTPFQAFGVAFDPISVSVGYATGAGEFQFSGSVGVATSSGDLTASGTLGTAGAPGLLVDSSGSVTQLSVTLSADVSTHGLSIDADGLAFDYQATTGNEYIIEAGSITASDTANDVSFQGSFGSGSQPGLVVTNGSLTSLAATLNGSATASGLALSVDNVQLFYENDSSSIYNGAFLIESGGVTIATSANDTVFAAQFGSGPNPGLVISNGSLANLYATVSSTISAQGLVINAAGLVFQYEGGSHSFEIATGSVSITTGTLEFASATFGASGNPGLAIKNGVLTGLDIAISSSMTVSGMSLGISQVQLVYEAVSGQTYGNFQIAAGGSVSLTTGPSNNSLQFQGTFGTTQNNQTLPGLSISDGVLQSFYVAVTSSISLGSSLTLSTTGLTFAYVASSQTFQIPSGTVSVADTSGDFSFSGTFGGTLSDGTTAPGLVVDGAALTELNVTVTSQFEAAGLTFTVDALDFYYNAAGNQYEIDSGSLSFKTAEGFSFSADFGLPDPSSPGTDLPGLVIVGGALTEFNAALAATFTVAGLVVDVDDVSMVYGSGQYEMAGTVTVDTPNISFTGTIGQPDAATPVYGLVIDGGSLESLAITINSDITIGDLTLQAENLAFNYDASPESFTLYGTVTASIAGVTLVGNLGTQSLPGLSLVNGQLTELNLGVTANFTLFDLQCNVQDLTFQYETVDGNTDYILYGGLSVAISGNTLSATMGSATDAGLIIQDGVVTQINMVINGSFAISGFSFDIVDAGLDYTSTANEYLIFGTFTLTDVFSASVELGTGSSNPGITVIDGVFQLDNFAFTLSNVPIGGFTLNYVTISYASAGDVWSGSGMVTFPTGWSISASLTFVDGNLDDISLAYDAGTSPGIEIPDTGIFVTEISASLLNLDEPASIIVSGTIEAVFGDKITIGGTTCTIFAATGSFTADSQELTVTGNYYEGAYESNGQWTGILGSGSATVDLDWSAGVYSASLSESLYDGTFTISASMTFDDSGDLAIMATAKVNVPDAVPFIGGETLGSMSFAFIYTASSNSGTVAAWTSVNCLFSTVTTGFQYTFDSSSTGDFSLIGAGGVSDIENDFNTISSADASTPPVYVYTYSVTVPSGSGANGVSVQATWPSNTGTQTLLISGPNDNGTYYSLTSSSLPSSYEFLTSYTTSTSQSVMAVGSATDPSVLLPSGTYSFEVQSTYQFSSTSDVTFTNQLYYEAPTVAITSVPTSALSFVPGLSGSAAGALASGTTITLYAQSTSTGYNGKPVGTFAYSAGSNGALQGVPAIDLSSYSPGVPIYIYAAIDDGVNSVVYSAVSTAIIPVPNLVGRVTDQFGNPIAGLRIYLDLDDDQQYDAPVTNASGAVTQAGDPSAITNAGGYYFFNNLESYSTTDVGYPDFRVSALMPSASFTPITPADGVVVINESSITSTSGTDSSITANFSVNRLASITGSLYSDLNQTGVYVATDPALGGATVYLDSSGTGTYQPGDPTCVTGPSGTYGFYDLTPGSYTLGILTSTTSNDVTTNLYVVTQPSSGSYTIPIASDAQQLTGYTLGVISLATISGTVTSETVQASSTTPLAGVTVDLSTPNLTASVPNYSTFSAASNLGLVGASVTSSGTLSLLSSGQSNVATAAWYKTAVPVSGGFETSFQWSMSSTSTPGGSSGFAFVLQNAGTSAKGSTAYGYGGIASSLAVVFDAADNEVLIETGGNTSASTALAVLSSAELGFSLTSGTLDTARITYLPAGGSGLGTLNVYLSGDSSGGSTPALSASVNLGSILGLGSSGTADLGFTGGTSGTGLTASVASWSATALTTQWTTTDSQGNYTFTGLMPLLSYSVSQVPPAGYIQATPSNTEGIYSQQTTGTSSVVESSVASGDFNGDGDPDIAYASSLEGGKPFQITYAFGNGQGGFGTPVTTTLPISFTLPSLATPANGAVAFDAFLAAGHFGSSSRDYLAYFATMAKGGHALVVFDVLQNKVVDAIEVESTAAPLSTTIVTAGYAGTINDVAVGDLNNDGYDDLAVSTYAGVYTLVSLQSLSLGTTWLVNPSTLANPLGRPALDSSSAVAYNAGVALADFNQDGNFDLVSLGAQYIPTVTKSDGETIDTWTSMTVNTTIQLAYGTGNGVNYQSQTQESFQSYSSSNIDAYFSSSNSTPKFPIPFGLAAADVSGDDVPDLVLNGYTSTLQPAVFLLTQSAPGTFTASTTVTIPNGKSFDVNGTPGANNTVVPGSTLLAAQVLAVDLNGDGYNDVAAVDPNVGQLLLLVSQVAPLTSGQTQNLQVFGGGALAQIARADFNLDGYPDLMVPGSNQYPSQSAPVLIQNGTINVGVIDYVPSNGQALTGQDFNDINFSGSSALGTTSAVSARSTSTSVRTSGAVKLVGQVFIDEDGNLRYTANESPLCELVLYLDLNQNGRFDPATEPSTRNNLQGYYEFAGLTCGQTYTVRIANLPQAFSARPLRVTMPDSGGGALVKRYLAVTQRWSVPQAVRTVEARTPIAIDLAPLAFRAVLDARPLYSFAGDVPEGMSIDPYTGLIQWTPPTSYAGSTVTVTVRIADAADRSPLETQTTALRIRVNPLSRSSGSAANPLAGLMGYIGDVFDALLGRRPTPAELAYWSARLQSGTSRLEFVQGLADTDEHDSVLTTATYERVLSRPPTAAEMASSVARFKAGGNSDQLTQALLTGPSFIQAHPTSSAYVRAVHQVLTGRAPSAARLRAEVAWLAMGGSRTRLVRRVGRSRAATVARVTRVVEPYLGNVGRKTLSKWVKTTVKLRLNSDALLERVLASAAYANASRPSPDPSDPSIASASNPRYNRLNHLAFALTGADATRSQLDALESRLASGQRWADLAAGVYDDQAAFAFRVRAQFQNLLHRRATGAELAGLAGALPAANQVDSLLVLILSGPEYRARFSSTASYVTEVYHVLTGEAPDAASLAAWVRKLDRGPDAREFVEAVNSSQGGRAGQVTRAYADYLLRDPTSAELGRWLGGSRPGTLQDRTIALALVATPEFQDQQRAAQLLPVD